MLVLAILAVEESAHETKPDWGFTRERGPIACGSEGVSSGTVGIVNQADELIVWSGMVWCGMVWYGTVSGAGRLVFSHTTYEYTAK